MTGGLVGAQGSICAYEERLLRCDNLRRQVSSRLNIGNCGKSGKICQNFAEKCEKIY